MIAMSLVLMASPAAKQKRPRITTSVLCGVVTDLAGLPISKASVAAMWADFGSSQRTDESGRWSFGSGSGPHWMKIDGDGFETFLFDYVDKEDPKDSGADKPAFMLPAKDQACPLPIYVRLAPRDSNKGFVTLDPTKVTPQGKEK